MRPVHRGISRRQTRGRYRGLRADRSGQAHQSESLRPRSITCNRGRKEISANFSKASDSSLVVGVLKLNLLLPENHSLKGKRGVLKSIQSRVANRFNVSVAECGDQDLWQSAVLGFGAVGSDRRVVEALLQKVVDFVAEMRMAELGQAQVECFYC